MKKLISFSFFTLLTVLAVCSLTACGGSDDDEKNGEPSTPLTLEQARAILTGKKDWTVTKDGNNKVVYAFQETTASVTETGSAFSMDMYNTWGLIAQDNTNYVKGKILVGGANVLCYYQNLSESGFQISYDQGATWLQAVPGEPVKPSGEEDKDPEEEKEDPNAPRLHGQSWDGLRLSEFNEIPIEYHWGSTDDDTYITKIGSSERQKDGSFKDDYSVFTFELNNKGTLSNVKEVMTYGKNTYEERVFKYQYDSKGRLISVNNTYTSINGSKKDVEVNQTCQFTWDNNDLITRMDFIDHKDGHTYFNTYQYSESEDFVEDRKTQYSAMSVQGYDKCLNKNPYRQFPCEISNCFDDPFSRRGLTAALGLLGPGPSRIPYKGAFSPSLPEHPHSLPSEIYNSTIYFVTPYRDYRSNGQYDTTRLIGKEVTEKTQYLINWKDISGIGTQYTVSSWDYSVPNCSSTEIEWKYTKGGK